MADAKTHVNIHISPDFQHLQWNLETFEQHFRASTKVLQKSRNTIKQLDFVGVPTVVKSFKKPNTLQGFIYRFFRKSKARRSFEYARLLLERGICTPQPIGYIEVRNRTRLLQSFYISALYDYDFMIRDVVENRIDNRDIILQAFVDFTFNMHQQHILHLDYSTGNTLIKQRENGYEFCVVDINRLKLGKISAQQGIGNFSRISNDPEIMKVIAESYAKHCNLNSAQCYYWLSEAIRQYRNYRERKRRLKQLVKPKNNC